MKLKKSNRMKQNYGDNDINLPSFTVGVELDPEIANTLHEAFGNNNIEMFITKTIRLDWSAKTDKTKVEFDLELRWW